MAPGFKGLGGSSPRFTGKSEGRRREGPPPRPALVRRSLGEGGCGAAMSFVRAERVGVRGSLREGGEIWTYGESPSPGIRALSAHSDLSPPAGRGERNRRLFLKLALQRLDFLRQRGVLGDQCLDLAHGVQHRGMVA